jgi:deoxyribodipyrimidine photo-lyase
LRRDLRVEDHAALHHALRSARQVWCAFVFDRACLDALPRQDRRVEFIRDSLVGVDAELRALAASHGVEGAGLIVRHGWAHEEIPALAAALGAQAVHASHDDEPAARARDARVRGLLADDGVALHTAKDHVVFERGEILTPSGEPCTAYAPYRTAWLKKAAPFYLSAYPVAPHASSLAALPEGLASGVPALEAIGFARTNLHQLRLPSGPAGAHELLADFLHRIDDYQRTCDYPAIKGPSYLGAHLRWGTISIRRLAREAHTRRAAGSRGADAWLSALIWRDFHQQVLYHHPRLAEQAFRPAFDRIKWEHGKAADALFAAWCEGRTGYPLVDAAMHQLAQTGYMHNRLRMLAAGFLVQGLGLDWRRGEAWFALHLNDFDLAANNGGWQWAASCGCHAQPGLRAFDPVGQSEKFDPGGKFIHRYLPALAGLTGKAVHAPWLARPADLAAAGILLDTHCPRPIVTLDDARARTAARFAQAGALRA